MASFADTEARFKQLRAQYGAGEFTEADYLEKVGQLMCRDDSGRWWTIHPETGVWHYRWREKWHPGVPPGHTPGVLVAEPPTQEPLREPLAAVEEPQPTAAPGAGKSWLLPALTALGLVAVVFIVVVFVVLPRSGRQSELKPTEALAEAEPSSTLEATQAPATVPPLFTPTPQPPAATETAPAPTEAVAAPTSAPAAADAADGPDAAVLRPDWQVALSDSFDDAASGWSRGLGEGKLVDYRDGRLLVELEGIAQPAWSRFEPLNLADGWAEVELPSMQGDNAQIAGGIALHVSQDFYGYVFRIDNRGRYGVGRTLTDAEPALVVWTASPAVRTDGRPNRLAVLAQGSRYLFFVNGWLVSDLTDDSYPEGLFVLWGSTDGAGRAQIIFDDARLLVASPEGQGPPLSAGATPTVSPPVEASTDLTDTIGPTETVVLPPTPLALGVSYEASYPGTGETWSVRVSIQAQGGDGDYSYQVGDRQSDEPVFEMVWPCGSNLSVPVIVRSGDGQESSQNLWVKAIACTMP